MSHETPLVEIRVRRTVDANDQPLVGPCDACNFECHLFDSNVSPDVLCAECLLAKALPLTETKR